jgi:hypothetical protein
MLNEAASWVDIAVKAGVFAPIDHVPNPDSVLVSILDPSERTYNEQRLSAFIAPELQRFSRRMGVIWERSPSRLLGYLDRAMHDLRYERAVYLQLLVFSDEHEWRLRLDELHELADWAARRPALSLRSEDAERVSWALDGSWSTLGSDASPAAWRSPYGLARAQPERLTERITELGEAQLRLVNHLSGKGLSEVDLIERWVDH